MAIFQVTTRITRRYLENKNKSDLAQMYLDLLDIESRERHHLLSAIGHWQQECVCSCNSCLMLRKLYSDEKSRFEEWNIP